MATGTQVPAEAKSHQTHFISLVFCLQWMSWVQAPSLRWKERKFQIALINVLHECEHGASEDLVTHRELIQWAKKSGNTHWRLNQM